MDFAQVCLLLCAGACGGAVNALAGGGSLITFPVLIATGLPPVSANVTNSVSVCPGYLAAVVGSRKDLSGQRTVVLRLVPTALLGTCCGAALLLLAPSTAFESVVPFLVIAAALTLALQRYIRRVIGNPQSMPVRRRTIIRHVLVGLGGLYGGYFGAALGVVLVAGLAVVHDTSLARISALKNVISAVVGLTTMVIYGVFAPVDWWSVLIVAGAAIVGGFYGAKLASRLPHIVFRIFIVSFGLIVGCYMLVDQYV